MTLAAEHPGALTDQSKQGETKERKLRHAFDDADDEAPLRGTIVAVDSSRGCALCRDGEFPYEALRG